MMAEFVMDAISCTNSSASSSEIFQWLWLLQGKVV